MPPHGRAGSSAARRRALLWLETPVQPRLDVCDIARAGRGAPRRRALVAVDNTLATPLGQRPLELGADFSLTSATKHLSGHADLLLGYVAARDPERAEAPARLAHATPARSPGPFEAWLAHRSLATLDVRLERGMRERARDRRAAGGARRRDAACATRACQRPGPRLARAR